MAPHPSNPVEQYLRSLRSIHQLNAHTPETSFYPALANLLNAVGDTLSPRVRFVAHPHIHRRLDGVQPSFVAIFNDKNESRAFAGNAVHFYEPSPREAQGLVPIWKSLPDRKGSHDTRRRYPLYK